MKKILVLSVICMAIMLASGCSKNENEVVVTDSNSVLSVESESETDAKETVDEEPTEIVESNQTSDSSFVFDCETIDNEAITSDVFADYDLTMINVMATWCGPCVNEMPHLGKIYSEMEPDGVNIIGFVTDCRSYDKTVDEEAVAAAKELRSATQVTYPMIIPDETFVNGMLITPYVPTTYFVDKEGNQVGDPVVGSYDYESWKETINERLEML